MQKKIGTILDDGILRQAKEAARVKHMTLKHVFEEALIQYLAGQTRSQSPISSVEASFGLFHLSKSSVRKIARMELYDA